MSLTQQPVGEHRRQQRVERIVVALGLGTRVAGGGGLDLFDVGVVLTTRGGVRVVGVVHPRFGPHRQHHLQQRTRLRVEVGGQLRHLLRVLPIEPQITTPRPILRIGQLTIGVEMGQ